MSARRSSVMLYEQMSFLAVFENVVNIDDYIISFSSHILRYTNIYKFWWDLNLVILDQL